MSYSSRIFEFYTNVKTVFSKEWIGYLNTPIGYIFAVLFLLLSSFLFFFGLGEDSFWDRNVASMEQFFLWIPLLYIVFVPAITMRLWSEEERTGTTEILFTLPLREYEIVFAKFIAAWFFLGTVLLTTVSIPFTIWALGDLDIGATLAGYLGCYLLGSCYISVGLLISALTKDQISAYLLTMLVCLFFFLLGYQPVLRFLGGASASFASFISLSRHFEPFRLGILDGKEIFYTVSFTVTALVANVIVLLGKRR